MTDPWFRILVSVPSSKATSHSLDVLSSIGRYDSHPLLVSIPQATLAKFIEFDENVEGMKSSFMPFFTIIVLVSSTV